MRNSRNCAPWLLLDMRLNISVNRRANKRKTSDLLAPLRWIISFRKPLIFCRRKSLKALSVGLRIPTLFPLNIFWRVKYQSISPWRTMVIGYAHSRSITSRRSSKLSFRNISNIPTCPPSSGKYHFLTQLNMYNFHKVRGDKNEYEF